MRYRHAFLADNLAVAERAVNVLRDLSVEGSDVALVARPDLEMAAIPDELRNADSDFIPAAMRGAVGGGAVGLVAGLVAMVIPALGITLAGAAAIAAVGATTGTWSASLMGSALPDPVRRKFDEHLEQGRIIVLVDAPEEAHRTITEAMARAGLVMLPYQQATPLQ